jgi:hypothetical protein
MGCRSCIAALVAAAAFGCSSKEFQSDGGDAGDAGMGGTLTGGSGPGGSGPTGGGAGQPNGGSGGSAGATGGSGGMACSCPPTEYCRGGECLPCSELATLDFGDPELVLDDPSGSLRFPRTGDTQSSLFYRVGNEGSARLHYTANADSLGSVVGSNAVLQESGPLFVGALGRTFNVIYDQTTDDPTSGRQRIMRAAAWSGGVLTGETDMPAPLSPGGHDDYSAAAATMLGRLFWMSTRDGAPRLRTGMIDTGEGDVVSIEVPKRTGSGSCARDGADATPWVTPEGHRMFFSAFPLGDTCQPLDAMTTDLFVVPLVPESGMPPLPAIALESLNEVGSTETDPSLSADFCFIYFASDRDAPGADFRLYRAARR